MPRTVLAPDDLRRALALRDLTDPSQGPHAMQELVGAVAGALVSAWRCAPTVVRAHPVVAAADNYDRLRYPPDGAARDARHTRWVSEATLLRTQASALVPPALRALAAARSGPDDVLLVCPGLVYRRDAIDRLHTGEPHQLDLWRLRRGGPPLGPADLRAMAALAVGAALPGRALRTSPAAHPYTTDGLQLDVEDGGRPVEVGECGVAHPEVLAGCGLDPARWTGLALGLGLDRLLMLRKGIPDIRLLRDRDPRVCAQMLDLAPWRPVSRHPPVRRDLSLAVEADATVEELGDRVREALGERAALVEAVELLAEVPGAALPPAAAARLGLAPGQKNALVRLVLRHLSRALTDAEANRLRDEVYAALHRGRAWQWACGAPPAAP